MNNEYDAIAEVYDSEYAYFQDDAPMYAQMAEGARGPILELGCGAGRALLPLAQSGFTCAGVDASAAMLELFQKHLTKEPKKTQQRVRLICSDMITPIAGNELYAFCFIALGALHHIADYKDRRAVFAAARSVMRTGGTLALDISQHEWRRLNLIMDSGALAHIHTWRDDRLGAVSHCISVGADEIPNSRKITHLYDIVQNDGLVRRITTDTVFADIALPEMIWALELTGWRFRNAFGDYEFGEWTEQSPRCIITAQAI